MFNGAEGRYEDYVFLRMMEQEWKRSVASADQDRDVPVGRPIVALLYWTYFETRIERVVRLGLKEMPAPLVEDVLDRYASITARLTKLYRLLFGTTYRQDLISIQRDNLWLHLEAVRERRNAFVHGDPNALDGPSSIPSWRS